MLGLDPARRRAARDRAGNVGTPLLEAVLHPEPYDVLAVELSSFQLHWSALGRAPLASRLPQRRARPPRLARLARGVRARPRAGSTQNTEIACVYNVAGPASPSSWSMDADVVEGCRAIGFTLGIPALSMVGRRRRRAGRPRVRRAAPHVRRRAGHARRPAGRRRRRVAPHYVANALAAAALARAYGVPPRRRPRRAARASVPDPHRIADVGDRRRGPLRRRLQGHQPARGRRLAAGLRARRLGRRRPAQGRRRSTTWSARARRPAARRRPHRRATGRGSPRPWPDTRPMSPSSTCPSTDTGAMDVVVDARPPRLARARRRRAARAGGRVDGHVRQLRRARRRLRRGRAAPREPTRRAARHREHHHQHSRVRASAPARPRSRAGAAPCRSAAAASTRRVTTYYLLLGATVAARRHRPGHGAVRLAASTSLRRRRTPPTPSSSSQLRFAVARRRSAPSSPAAIPVRRVEAARRCRPARRVVLLQVLVFTPLGVDRQRQPQLDRASAAVQVQPSEFAKLGLVLFGAAVLAKQAAQAAAEYVHAVVPLLSRSAASLLAARPRRPRPRHRAGPHRDRRRRCSSPPGCRRACSPSPARPRSVLAGASWSSPAATGWAASRPGSAGAAPTPTAPAASRCHGLYALADGGWWGVGLGASREKWQWLPEAHNDFIFAIIGEELGLPGTLVVLGLFARPRPWPATGSSARTDDLFVRDRHAPASWPGSSVQAIINIGAVIGAAAGHRRAAAAGVRRRLGAGHHAVRPRHAALLRPPRTRLPRGAARPRRRRASAARSRSCPAASPTDGASDERR